MYVKGAAIYIYIYIHISHFLSFFSLSALSLSLSFSVSLSLSICFSLSLSLSLFLALSLSLALEHSFAEEIFDAGPTVHELLKVSLHGVREVNSGGGPKTDNANLHMHKYHLEPPLPICSHKRFWLNSRAPFGKVHWKFGTSQGYFTL